MHILHSPCLCNHTQNAEPSTYMHMAHTPPLLTLQLLSAHSYTHSFTHSHLHSPSSSSLLRARVSAISLTMGCSLASRTWRCSWRNSAERGGWGVCVKNECVCSEGEGGGHMSAKVCDWGMHVLGECVQTCYTIRHHETSQNTICTTYEMPSDIIGHCETRW